MLRDKMDPRNSNGGVFLGLNGVVIKSHGGTDRGGLRRGGRHGLRNGASRVAGQDRRNHSPACARPARPRAPPAEPPRDGASFRCAGLRQLSAGARHVQPGARGQGRDHRRLDRAAHRHPSAPYRSRRRGDLRPRHPRGQGGARQRPCRCPVDRSDRARHLDAGQHVPGVRGLGAERARHHPRRRLRRAGGLLGLRLWHFDHRCAAAHRHLQARAGDRRRDLLAHPRLDRPHHLRAVRRRRRRHRHGGAAAARRRRATAAC